MPYTPNPDDATAPLESVLAGTAAAEFRAFKTKVNNLFLEASYSNTLLLQGLVAGLSSVISLPAGTDTRIMYGYATNITRNDIAGSGAQVVAGQFSAILGNNLDGLAKNITVFGAATEAWTSPVASQATLVGLESSIISQYNANEMALLTGDFVFKNRPDSLFSGAVVQGLGADKYNSNSRAIQISAQPRSTAQEKCGFGRGLVFQDGSLDSWYDTANAVIQRAIGIDFTPLDGPFTFEPWTAYDAHASSAALKIGPAHGIVFPEYLGISWDRMQFTRTYLDSNNHRFVIYGDGASPTTTPRLAFDYTNNYIDLPSGVAGGAPAAADASHKIKIGGAEYLLHLTAV